MSVDNIDDLRRLVNFMTSGQLKDFGPEAGRQARVKEFLGIPIRSHLLAAANALVGERALGKGIKLPTEAKEYHPPHVVRLKSKMHQKPQGRSGKVKVVKVSPEEMEKLWSGKE